MTGRQKEKAKIYRAKNKAIIAEKAKVYREKNKDKIREYYSRPEVKERRNAQRKNASQKNI